jgi:hypothetical protein
MLTVCKLNFNLIENCEQRKKAFEIQENMKKLIKKLSEKYSFIEKKRKVFSIITNFEKSHQQSCFPYQNEKPKRNKNIK